MLKFQAMSMIHNIRFLLLLVFALLQCVAPLAHAHVNGDSADQNPHLATIDASWSGSHDHDASAEQCAIETDHSAVVSMPPEYRYSDMAVAHVNGASPEPLLALRAYTTISFVTTARQSFSLLPYQLPCSQAPPVKTV
jgi:hypothetical protein